MATVEEHAPQTQDGAAGASQDAGHGIPVENPATGEIIATVPDLGAEAVAEMAARGRAAQPGWEAFGFEGRARVLLRAQKWLMDNAEQVVSTIVSETGKTFEDASLAEIGYAGNAFGFWAREAPNYLGDEKVKSSQALVKGKKILLRYRPPYDWPAMLAFLAARAVPAEESPEARINIEERMVGTRRLELLTSTVSR